MAAVGLATRTATAPPIEDYALIGDCRSAALVSRSGSIDWLCLPDFSSPSVFAAILDPDKGGRFAITPVEPCRVARRYVDDSAVLETSFKADSGTARLIDAMPVGDPAELQPQREILRIVEGVEGRVAFELRFEPRPGYARKSSRIVERGGTAFICTSGNEQLLLRSEVPLSRTPDRAGVLGRFAVGAGERVCFSLAYVSGDIAVLLPLGDPAAERIQRTIDWWKDWLLGCMYDGPHRPAVIRSAVALKLMTFAISGAVIAAPTTSLPEAIGGERNWDYRYCWLRDAALIMRAFLSLGLRDEAGAFLRWLLHATALTRPSLSVMYDVYGRTNLQEEELGQFSGYRGSRPVRIGNGAYRQLQLDAYGSVISAAVDYALAGGSLQRDQLKLVAGFGETVCGKWREPDHGIWESRGEPQHYTVSKLMCWLALDRLLQLAERRSVPIDRAALAREREAIRAEIEERGYNSALDSYVDTLDGDRIDASLLLMGCLGYARADDPRMRSTFDRIRERLGSDGLIYRYEQGRDGFASLEGAFGLCSFWAVDNLVLRGDLGGAQELLAHLLGFANDLCLFSEELDAKTGAALGNFPQAFTHVGLINSAVALAAAARERAR